MKRYEVKVAKWVDGSGWSYSTTIDWLDDPCTAENYILSLDREYPAEGEDYLYTIVEHTYDPETDYYDEDSEPTEYSSAWLSETWDDYDAEN